MTTPTVPMLSPQDMDRLSRLMFQLAHNDKTRPYIAQLVKQVDPQSAKAFADIEVKQELANFRKELADEKLKEQTARVVAAKDTEKRQVIQKYKYNETQIKDLEKIQTHYGLSSWDAAARIYTTFRPPENPELKPPPEALDGSTWDFPTVPGPDGKMLEFKDYIKDPRKHSNKLAYQMITDFKRTRLPHAFQHA